MPFGAPGFAHALLRICNPLLPRFGVAVHLIHASLTRGRLRFVYPILMGGHSVEAWPGFPLRIHRSPAVPGLPRTSELVDVAMISLSDLTEFIRTYVSSMCDAMILANGRRSSTCARRFCLSTDSSEECTRPDCRQACVPYHLHHRCKARPSRHRALMMPRLFSRSTARPGHRLVAANYGAQTCW